MTASIWRPLVACLLCGAALGWTAQGWRKDATIAGLHQVAATSAANAANRLTQATARVLTLERAAGAAMVQRAGKLTEEQDHAKTERDRFNAAVRSGAVRLSIPVASGQCTTGAGSDHSPAAGGDQHQARAELDRETAATLGAIAGDGDDAIRQLNACIDAYHSVMEKFNVQAQ
ncbi:lysis system i-spanin subunit Rz [Duganella phyllosphaerae]|uniref:Bacteriophage lysis protein n=1 Tax=Duganella phyllosphaerae TaxID=762836 RepID=A0A1E7WJA6_9BURK|nr:lysis system i-spanin subunit Rz [Duganella phyllosphaerae]OEZ98762.1 bacteriophage lysis protein [Duganella phyllosphaerae]